MSTTGIQSFIFASFLIQYKQIQLFKELWAINYINFYCNRRGGYVRELRIRQKTARKSVE
ncbi:MAG: hypothetical protein D8M57_05825 [Candidatus Scalindua sp. AMX11]|nr:MAG: hypothetical protein DWQ00_12775 [Candidatus Scalindua sp.]TDE65822.1 MAG: hypothetical protein D8M57_05825 [Candidatus Scalindua sp. AMX11]